MKVKVRELRDRSDDELRKMLSEEREKLRSTRFGVATAQNSKVRGLRDVKKTIARILTLLTERANEAKRKV